MWVSGMGTNLKHESFSGSYTWDLNMQAVDSRCLPGNKEKTFENGLHYNDTLQPLAVCRQLGSNEEDSRQTILKQQVIFDDQVLELHCLYKRQMELISEVEKKQQHRQSDYTVKMSYEPRDLDSIPRRPNSSIDLNEHFWVEEGGTTNSVGSSVDLNEHYRVEEGGTTNSVDSLGPGISQGEIPGRYASAKTKSVFEVLFGEGFGNSESKKSMDVCLRPQEQLPHTDEAGHNRGTLVKFQLPSISCRGRPRRDLERSPIVVLALPAFNAPAPFNKLSRRSIARSRHTSKLSKLQTGGSSTCSPRHGHARSRVSSQRSHFGSLKSSTDHDLSPGHHAHKKHFKGPERRDMDLHSIPTGCSPKVVSQQICSIGKHQIDLKPSRAVDSSPALSVPGASVLAPISPENQEYPRPGGESEETSLQSQGKDTSNASPSNTLVWFATVCLDHDTQSRLVSGKNGAEQEGLSCNEVDCFEDMKLRLPELKLGEHLCKTSCPNEAGTYCTIFLSQPKKRRRGRQRKGSQREIPPSLTSLARQEVTEDLQTIGGLMKAAGSPPGTKLASDATGKSKQSRGRKRMRASVSYLLDTTRPMPLKPADSPTGPVSGERWLTGWGNGRRRGQRQRASNPSLFSSLPMKLY